MKAHWWVVVVIALAAVVAAGWYYGGRWMKLNQRAEALLMEKVSPLVGKDFAADEVELRLGSIRLRGVRAVLEAPSCVCYAEEIRIGYNLLALFSRGFESRLSKHNVVLLGPVFVFSPKGQPTDQRQYPPPLSFDPRGLPIRKLGVKDGRVAIERLGKRIPLIEGLRGWASQEREGDVAFQAEGHVLSKRSNLALSGSWSRTRGLRDVDITLGPADLALSDLGSLLPQVKPKQGRIEAACRYDAEEEQRLSGHVKIDGLGVLFERPEVELESSSLRADIRGDSLVITSASGTVLDAAFEASGYLHMLPAEPLVHLRADLRQLDVQKLARLARTGESLGVSGTATLSVDVVGPLSDPVVRGRFEADRIALNGIGLEHLQAELDGAVSHLTLRDLCGHLAGGQVTGHTRIIASGEGQAPSVEAELKAVDMQLRSLAEVFRRAGLQAQASAKFSASGSLKRPAWQAWLEADSLVWRDLKLGAQSVQMAGQGDTVSVRSAGDLGELCAEVAHLLTRPTFHSTVSLGPFSWFLPSLQDTLGLSAHIRADGDRSLVRLTGQAQADLRTRHAALSLQGRLSDVTQETWNGTLAIKADSIVLGRREFAADTWVRADRNAVETSFSMCSLDTVASGRIVLQLKTKALDGVVSLSRLPLTQGMGRLFSALPRVHGLVDAKAAFGGTLDHPKWAGSVALSQGSIGRVDSLSATVIFDKSPQRWSFSNGKASRSGHNIARFHCTLDTAGKFEGQASGDDVDASTLWRALMSQEASPTQHYKGLSGTLSYRVAVEANGDSSRIGADFALKEGGLWGVSIDRAIGTMEGDLEALRIRDLHLEEKGRYGATVSGSVTAGGGGAGSKDQLDLYLIIEGDVLYVLSRLADLDLTATGQGLMTCRLVGSVSSPELASGRLTVDGGALPGWHVTGDMEDIVARLAVNPGKQFLEIEELTARVRGGRISVSNLESLQLEGSPVAPLVFEPLNLSLGVLAAETGKSGVDLDIHSLMEDRGPGRVFFAGRTENEQLYVGGPAARPFIRGTWLVSNTSFTYPLAKATGPPSEVVRILRSAAWDFRVTARDNVRYFREVPVTGMPIARDVSVELNVERGRHIDFHGSLQDGTFHARGDLAASGGTITYLDTEFQVEEAGVSIDTQYEQQPVLRGRARTTVTDTLGVPTDIFLEICSVDEGTDATTAEARWDKMRFELRSSDPRDGTNQDILIKLGYSLDRSPERAVGVLSKAVDRRLVSPILRTVERRLQRATGLDVVGFTPTVVSNLLFLSRYPWEADPYETSYLGLLRGTTFRVGKYVLNGNWFVSYSGQLESTVDPYQRELWGLRHSLGLEYAVQANTRLEFEYDYDRLLGQKDRRVSVRHYFPF